MQVLQTWSMDREKIVRARSRPGLCLPAFPSHSDPVAQDCSQAQHGNVQSHIQAAVPCLALGEDGLYISMSQGGVLPTTETAPSPGLP